MKYFLLSFFSFFLFFINPVNSEQNIAFINMDKVISTSNAGSSILKQLTDLNNKNLQFLKNEEKKFKEKETKLISQKNIISEADFQNKVNELKSEIKNYNQNRDKMINEFNKLKVDNTNNLLKLINPILLKFSDDKEISIVLQKKDLVVAKTELDITEDIIKIVNAEIKEIKIKYMIKENLNKKQIANLLPHREPMLLIDELHDIDKLSSATAIVYVKRDSFFVQGHFPDNPVMPGVLIVEAFGQAAAALTAHGLDKETYDNKLVFLMGIEKARFRNPVIPDCKLELKIQAIRTHGRVWKYKGDAFVEGKKMADAQWSATIVDKK